MNHKITHPVSIEIFGQTYQIRCPETEVLALKKAAQLFEDKMRVLRDSGNGLSLDRLAVLAGLNLAHQFLGLEQEAFQQYQQLQLRLLNLYNKIETTLSQSAQLELGSVESE